MQDYRLSDRRRRSTGQRPAGGSWPTSVCLNTVLAFKVSQDQIKLLKRLQIGIHGSIMLAASVTPLVCTRWKKREIFLVTTQLTRLHYLRGSGGMLSRNKMKHLLGAVAVALVISAPGWAQSPSGGNSMGSPGPNPGGPGLTPYSGGGAPPPSTAPAPMPSMPAEPPPGAAAAPPPPNSAMPPHHHAVRHARAMHAHHMHMARKAALSGDTTAQLNREELARIQSGNTSNPPAPPAPPPGH